MTNTTVRPRLHKLVAALPHVLVHAALGMLIAAVLGWPEAASQPVNEFNGLYWVIAVRLPGHQPEDRLGAVQARHCFGMHLVPITAHLGEQEPEQRRVVEPAA